MKMPEQTINCSQCGNQLPLKFRLTKLVVCDQCESTLYLHDGTIEHYGKSAALTSVPSLVQFQQPFTYQQNDYLPVGQIRYLYGHGFWDEYWCLNKGGEGIWVSVDEGDYAFERPIEPPFKVAFRNLSVGRSYQKWLITEKDHAICEGFRGELPELVQVGDEYDYMHLSGIGGRLLTLEYADNEISATQGQWIDPFEIKVAL